MCPSAVNGIRPSKQMFPFASSATHRYRVFGRGEDHPVFGRGEDHPVFGRGEDHPVFGRGEDHPVTRQMAMFAVAKLERILVR